MPEYIKREDAIAVAIGAKSLGNTAYSDRFEIASRIRALPAADVVERKSGEWVERPWVTVDNCVVGVVYYCSKCGKTASEYTRSNYCPKCGAWMEGLND